MSAPPQQQEMSVAEAGLLAQDLFDRHEFAQAIDICNQIVAHDNSAARPYAIFYRACVVEGNWPKAVEAALMTLSTRPKYEAGRLLGETLNLLHALEHQAGRPEAAKRWLDLETFPITLELSAFLDQGQDRVFCDELFDEVTQSPLLQATTDPQSRGWIVADILNREGCGPKVRALEPVFRELIERTRGTVAGLYHQFQHAVFKTYPAEATNFVGPA